MLYDFTLCTDNDREPISLIRTYSVAGGLSQEAIQDIINLVIQACDVVCNANNVVIYEETFLEFKEEWFLVTEDEPLKELISDEIMIDTIAQLNGKTVREMARVLLNDLASTDYGKSLFEGMKDALDEVDLDTFPLIGDHADNENLKVPIGSRVYVRGQGNEEYNYLGRPTAKQLQEDPSRFFSLNYDQETGGLIGEVCAIDKESRFFV